MSLEPSILNPVPVSHGNPELDLISMPIIELSYEDECRLFHSTNIGDENADIYIWEAAESLHEAERIANFISGKGGDVLQLSGFDLFNLGDQLSFSYDGQHTTLSILCAPNKAKHQIILENIDLTVLGQTNEEITETLIKQGNLDVVGAI